MRETITVNGRTQPYVDQTVRELLAAYDIDAERPGIAVAVNAGVTPRAAWARTRLRPGDRVEIIHPKAGG